MSRRVTPGTGSESPAHDDVLAYAARTRDVDLARTARAFGRPPYRDPLAYAVVMGYYQKIEPYTPPAEYTDLGNRAGNDVGLMGIRASSTP